MTKDEVIAKLEQATEGCWELDKEIAVLEREKIGDCADDEVPAYTTSIDAALTLVPEGWFWRVGRTTSFPAWAGVHKTHPDHSDPNKDEFFWKRENWEPPSTPILALCIASLKARG